MTWFKVEDNFWSHPKVMHLSSHAAGVWLRSAAYCSAHLTDGRITGHTIEVICPESRAHTRRAIAELVTAVLWDLGTQGDEYVFHDWAVYQSTRAEVEAKREAEREKKARQRRNAAGKYAPVPEGQT